MAIIQLSVNAEQNEKIYASYIDWMEEQGYFDPGYWYFVHWILDFYKALIKISDDEAAYIFEFSSPTDAMVFKLKFM